MAAPGPDYEAMKSDELSSLLRKRGLPIPGNKSEKKARLMDADAEADGSTTVGADVQMEDEWETTSESSTDNAIAKTDKGPYDWVLTCQPTEDYVREQKDKDDDYDEDEDPFLRPAKRSEVCKVCHSRFKMCGRPVAEEPDYPWIIMRKGLAGMQFYEKEMAMRSQEVFGQYHFNDYDGYGVQEVVQNLLKAFNQEYSKKTKNIFELWLYIETFSRIEIEETGLFWIDDSDGLLDMMELVGWMVLATLDELEKADQLKPGSDIKDLTLTIGLVLQVIESWPGDLDDPQIMWGAHVAHRLNNLGYQFAKVPHGIESTIDSMLKEEPLTDELFEEIEANPTPGDDRPTIDYRQVNWAEKFAEYQHAHRPAEIGNIGGKHYVLGKIP